MRRLGAARGRLPQVRGSAGGARARRPTACTRRAHVGPRRSGPRPSGPRGCGRPDVLRPRRPRPSTAAPSRGADPLRAGVGDRSSPTTSTARPARLAGAVAPHDRLERGRRSTAPAGSRSATSPRSARRRLGPARRHAGARLGEPGDARHGQQLRRLLGPAPQRRRSARDRRHRELRPDQAGGRPAGLAPLLRRDARHGRQRVRGRRPGPGALAGRAGLPDGAEPWQSFWEYHAEFTVGGDTVLFEASDGSGNQAYRRHPAARPPPGARQRRPVPPAAVQQGRRARARGARRHRGTACSSTGSPCR